jgi:OOP family OmpA-OmpF porin
LRFVLSEQGRALVRAHGFVPSAGVLPTGAAEARSGEAVASRQRMLERLVFPNGATRLSPLAHAGVRRIAREALANPRARVFVAGHADTEGTEPENERIGLERARAAATALERLGVASDRITVETRGSTAPIATNRTIDGRALNRRADVSLVD